MTSVSDNQTGQRDALRPLPPNLDSVQPGGGICYRLELAWGSLRRAYLKAFRRGYIQRMAELRTGSVEGAPHEILDPRDLKYCRNLCTVDWAEKDDPFSWRERIPFARWGLAELQLMSYPLVAATIVLAFTAYWWLSVVPGVVLALIVYFFRDPPRIVPDGHGLLVSPADGKVVEITQLEHHPLIGGSAVRIGIFLSIFNVHINRSPAAARCLGLEYSPGKYLNALKPESALENEALTILFEDNAAPYRNYVVRQIAGAIARRIVCAARIGEDWERGGKFGMIKLGSRTELIIPQDDSLEILTKIGEKVKAGSSMMARYASPDE
ncbi:MAG: phosphatidylserine decarboxylase [Pirellulales bacterium]|nr:phosphatidylserine decarboxylase [Pirellulales bacterium]